MFLGAFLLGTVIYYRNSRCENCGEYFAYKESSNPSVRDIETRDGTRRSIKRYYTCKFCGHKKTKSFSELIEHNNED